VAADRSYERGRRASKEILKRYPASVFRRYPRWRPGWTYPTSRRFRFLYIELLRDFIIAHGVDVREVLRKDGIELSCATGEVFFCTYRDRGWSNVGRTDTELARLVSESYGEDTAIGVTHLSQGDKQEDITPEAVPAQRERDIERMESVLRDLPASEQPSVDELRRQTLLATLFTPFLYALLIVGLVLGHYPGEQLFGKGELFLAAGVALTPALMLAQQKSESLRKAGIIPLNMTSVYNGALLLLWLCNFTLWLTLTIGAERGSGFHSRWVAEWGGIAALLIAFNILSPFSRPKP
jgi:hypothetical protein